MVGGADGRTKRFSGGDGYGPKQLAVGVVVARRRTGRGLVSEHGLSGPSNT